MTQPGSSCHSLHNVTVGLYSVKVTSSYVQEYGRERELFISRNTPEFSSWKIL